MKIQGTFKKLLTIEKGVSKQGKQWEKQSFILDTGDDYNPEVCITAFGKEMDLIININIGDRVACRVNISSREFIGRYYHNINLWQIEVINDNDSEDIPF